MPVAAADALAEARAIPEPLAKQQKIQGPSKSNPGRAISSVVNKPKPCATCKQSKTKKIKKKKCKNSNCSTCSGIYPISYPGGQAGKPNDESLTILLLKLQFKLIQCFFFFICANSNEHSIGGQATTAGGGGSTPAATPAASTAAS